MNLEKNMQYNITIQNEKVFAKDISKISPWEVSKIFLRIEAMKTEGIIWAQVKKLKNYKGANFRIRVGNYRILLNFSLENHEITLLRVLYRSKLY